MKHASQRPCVKCYTLAYSQATASGKPTRKVLTVKHNL